VTQALFDKYYPKSRFEGGTLPFFRLCRENIPSGSRILEIGAGPTNACSETLSGIGDVSGIDIDPDVSNNRFLSRAVVYDGRTMPFAGGSFDACVSNWVLEHVEHPLDHFREVARVLRPGGVYCVRTPNLYHYVSLGAHLMPHSVHLLIANRLRGMGEEAHDPYPTWFRSNSRGKLRKLCRMAGLGEPAITMIEPEPAYGRAHPVLFYGFMGYERLVNSSRIFAGARITILMAVRKPDNLPRETK
jgi:SAM-dependent methyltransferase